MAEPAEPDDQVRVRVALTPHTVVDDVAIDPSNRIRRVLIVVHGIRDRTGWAAHFNNAIADGGYDATVAPTRYRRYSALPFIFGHGLASRRRSLLDEVAKIASDPANRGALFDIFCHSNGTKLFAEIVGEPGVPNFETVILAGSVCKRENADAIADKVRPGRFWNICGKKDRWPILATAIRPDLFEDTGVVGMQHAKVHDRFHDFGHGGALQKPFVEELVKVLLFGDGAKGKGAPAASIIIDPWMYRKILASLFASLVFSIRFIPWWLAAIVCGAVAYMYYRWPHDR